MNIIETTLVGIQWGTIFIFMLFHLFLGIKRGIRKTTYYFITSVIITIFSVLCISFISIQGLINLPAILSFIESTFGFTIPSQYRAYLMDPNISFLILGLLDILIKIIAFILIYPVIKFLLTVTLFRIIWNKMHKNRFEKKHGVPLNVIFEIDKNYKPMKKSRFFGGTLGIIRGGLTAYVLLLPLLFILSSVSNVNINNNETTTNQSISTSETEEQSDDLMFSIIKEIDAFNKVNINNYINKVKFGKHSIDEMVMSALFTVDFKTSTNETIKVDLGNEIKVFGGIFSNLVSDGYLSSNFDYNDIAYETHYEGIDNMLENLGSSTLIPAILPTALDILDNQVSLQNALGFQPSKNSYTQATLELLKKLDWQAETSTISNVIEELLQIGSVEEIIEYINNPDFLLDLPNEKLRKLGHALNYISQLELLHASTIGLEYFLQQQSTHNLITWHEDPYTYLHERLEFLFEEGFIQEDLAQLSELIMTMFDDKYEDFDYQALFGLSDNDDLGIYFNESNSEFISEMLGDITRIETLLNALPFVVDYAVYTSTDMTIEAIAHDIVALIENDNFSIEEELEHVNSIYEILVQMGIESAFSGEEEIMNALDQILLRDGNFEHAKSIVKVIFEDSYAVNEVLGIVAQPLVERFIEDEPTQNLILDIILEESFEYGKEVVTLLNITEHVYSFTTIGQIQNAIDNDDYFSIIDRLGTLNEVQYENLKSDIYALQVLNLGSRDLIEFIKDEASLEILSIPLGTDIVSIKQDLDKGLDLLFVAAKQIHTHQITKDNFEDVDLLSVIPFEVIADILRFDEVKDENSILLNTVVDFISDESIQLGSYGHITLPSELESKPYNDKVWVDEINYLLLGSLDILKEVSTADTDFNFSIKNINRINGLEDIPAKLVTSLNNEDKIDRAFHKLTSSLLLKYNAVEIGTKILESSENAFDFAVPINYYKSEDLSSDNLTELLKISINLFSRTILDETDNLASQIDKLDLARMIYTFNGLEEVMIERIGYQVTINNIFRSLATNTSIHQYVYDSINQLNIEHLDIIDDGIFDLNSSIDATGKLRSSTLYQLLSFARNLEVPTNINHLSEKELIDYMDQRLSPELIDQLFDIHLVHEVLSNTLKLEQVKTLGQTYFEEVLQGINQSGFEISLSYETYYNRLMTVLIDEESLISREEIKSYVSTYVSVVHSNIDFTDIESGNYNSISNEIFTTHYNGKNILEHLTSTKLFRGFVGEIISDDDFLLSAVTLINQYLVLDGDQVITLKAKDIKISSQFFDEGGLKADETYDLLQGILKQDLDIIKRGSFTLNDLKNLIDTTPEAPVEKLSYLYDSGIFEFVLKRVIESEKVHQAVIKFINREITNFGQDLVPVENLLTRDDFHLTYNLINYDGLHQMIHTVSLLEVDDFSDFADIRSIADIRRILKVETTSDVLDEVAKIPLIFELYKTLVTSDKIAEILTNALDTHVIKAYNLPISAPSKDMFILDDSYINYKELSNLMLAVLGVNMDVGSKFTSPELIKDLLEPTTVAGKVQNSILHLLDSNIIYHHLDSLLQASVIKEGIVGVANKYLGNLDISLRLDTEDFMIPVAALNSEGRIDKNEFVTMVEAVSEINISNYTELNQLNSPSQIKHVIPIAVFEKLFESKFIHYTASELMLGEASRTVIAELANNALASFNVDINLSENDFLIPNRLLDENLNVKVNDFMTIIESIYMTNQDSFNLQLRNPKDIERLIPVDALNNLMSSEVVSYGLTQLLQGRSIRQGMAQILNSELNKQTLSLPNTTFNADDFLLPTHLLDHEGYIKDSDITLLARSFYNLNIDHFSQIKLNSPTQIEDVIPIEIISDLMFETDIVHYILDTLIQSEKTRSALATITNQYASEFNLKLELTASAFSVPDLALEDDMIMRQDIVDLVSIFYQLGIENFGRMNFSGPKQIEAIMSLDVFNELLDVHLVYGVVNELATSSKMTSAMADMMNQYTQSFGLPTISSSVIKLPNTALVEGKISKVELSTLVEIFYALEVDNFNELSRINTPERIKSIVTKDYFNHLLESEIIYYLLGYVPQTQSVRNTLADFANTSITKQLGTQFNLQADDFLLDQYDVLIQSGSYKGYVTKLELEYLYNSFLVFDTTAAKGNMYQMANRVIDELLRPTDNGMIVLDEALTSNILVTIFNRLINLEQSPHIETSILNMMGNTIKSAGIGQLTFNQNDHIFKYHPSALDLEGNISREEIKRMVYGLDVLDFANDLSIKGLTGLIGKNVDINGLDDFDRFYSSMVMQSILSNFMLNDRFVGIVSNQLNGRQSRFEFSKALLSIPLDVVEEGIIFESEMKQLLNTLNILNIESTDITVLGLDMFIDLLDRNIEDGSDDLDRFLESHIIHTYIDRIMKSDSLNKLMVKEVSGMLDDSITAINSSLNDSMLDSEGMFSKYEFRGLLEGLKLLGVRHQNDLGDLSLSSLIGLNNESDDLETFLTPNYLRTMIGRMLSSTTIRTKIATNADFDDADLTLNTVTKDSHNEMSKAEVKAVLVSLDTLGITDLGNMSVSNETLKQLTNEELDTVLASNYFYQVIDLTLKVELGDDVVPSSLVKDATAYDLYIKKSEIKDLIEALRILNVDNPSDLNANTMTIRHLEELLNLESQILRKLMSNAISDEVNVPELSYGDYDIILDNELNDLISALTIILGSKDETIGGLDMGSTTITSVMFANLLNIGVDRDAVNGSHIVTRLISESVIDSFKERLHQDAYASEFDILRVELYFLKDALFELEIYEITSDLDLANVSTIKVRNIHDYDSIILNHLISEEIESNIEDIPLHAYEDDDIANDIKYNEVTKLIDAMLYLGVDISSIDALDLNILDGQTIQELKAFDSIIINHMISEEVKTNIDDIPDDAYEDQDKDKNISDDELTRLIDVLIYLNVDLGRLDSLNLESLHANDIKDIYYISSIIINHMISNEIIDAVDAIPLEAYVDQNPLNDLTDEEILKLIEVMILLDVEINQLDNLDLDILNAKILDDIHQVDSLIINHMISNEIKANVTDIPSTSYIDEDEANDIKPEEITKLLEALDIIGEPISGLSTLDTRSLSFDDLSEISQLDSGIIDRLISNGLKDSDVIVTDHALDSEGHVEKSEVTAFINAINNIEDVNNVDEFVVYIQNLTIADLPTLLVLADSDSVILKDTANQKISELI